LCVECLKSDVVTAVKAVDHIVAINAGGAKLDEANCQLYANRVTTGNLAANLGVWGKKSRRFVPAIV
jgi:hypothetical protein